MTTAQRIIKYCATAFAILLIFGIFSTVIKLIGGLSFISSVKNDANSENNEMNELVITDTITKLDIDVASVAVSIKNGEKTLVEWDSEYITAEVKNNTLKINEKNRFSLLSVTPTNEEVSVYLPAGYELDSVDFDSGAGVIYIEELNADKLDFDLGTGDVTIDKINVTDEAEIQGGAGKFTIKGGSLAKLELDMGVGELNLTSAIPGNSDIDFGVGEANITLIGVKDDYKLNVNKGIGNINIDGESVGNGSYGDGGNKIKLDGGIGSINISFK